MSNIPDHLHGSDLTCQFCGQQDYDAPGLKAHLLNGWCEIFEHIERPPHPLDRLLMNAESEEVRHED